MFRIRRPSDQALDELLARAANEAVTYREIGATRDVVLPPGYRHDRFEARIGSGRSAYERSVQALRAWQAQRGAGLAVWPAEAMALDDATVLLLIRVGPVWAIAPCRVVYTEEAADTFAFAYGTLPGHPERGEVAFTLQHGADGAVSFRILSFSRPAHSFARLGAPLSRRLQRHVTLRYVSAMRAAATD